MVVKYFKYNPCSYYNIIFTELLTYNISILLKFWSTFYIYFFIITTTFQDKRESLEPLTLIMINLRYGCCIVLCYLLKARSNSKLLLLITVTLNEFTWKLKVTSLIIQDSYSYWNEIIIPFGDAITIFNNILKYGTIEEWFSRQLKKMQIYMSTRNK